VVAGLGKGTGSGGGPEVLRIAKEKGIITLAVATFPSTNIEGEATLENAMKSYENYKKYATSICIVDNEKLIGGNKKNDLTLNQEFQKSNEEVYQIVNDIIEMVAIGTDNNIDLNDLKNFLKSNSLLNHLTIEIPNDNYNSNKVIKIIDEQIKNSTLKNNLSSEKINILSNAKFSRNAPRSIYDDLKTAIKEIAQHDKINMTIGHDMTDDNKNTICLFISNIEKQYDIFAPIIAAEFNDASSNTEVESEAPRTKTKRMHRGKPAKKGKGKFSENLGFDED
jgi:cell division protein FtsZ